MKKTILLLLGLPIFLFLQFFPQFQSTIHIMNGKEMTQEMTQEMGSSMDGTSETPCYKSMGCINLNAPLDSGSILLRNNELPNNRFVKPFALLLLLLIFFAFFKNIPEKTFRLLQQSHLKTVATTVFIE